MVDSRSTSTRSSSDSGQKSTNFWLLVDFMVDFHPNSQTLVLRSAKMKIKEKKREKKLKLFFRFFYLVKLPQQPLLVAICRLHEKALISNLQISSAKFHSYCPFCKFQNSSSKFSYVQKTKKKFRKKTFEKFLKDFRKIFEKSSKKNFKILEWTMKSRKNCD